jgi:hypothetical protein
MFLILHAVKMLPAARETPLIPSEDQKTNIFGLDPHADPTRGNRAAFLAQHDLVGKPVPTFPDHAL